jgi:thioredoxin-like negative regulator of GroEL
MIAAIPAVAPVGCGCEAPKQDPGQDTVTLDESQQTSDTAGISPSEAALEKARQEGRPVLLNFHSTQCYPCIEIEKIINQVKPDYEDRVEFIVVDVYDPSEQDLCYDYNIQTIPTTVFLDAAGQVTEGYVGVIDEASMRQMLDRLIGKI